MMDKRFRTISEPFRIHSVAPMRLTTWAERTAALSTARANARAVALSGLLASRAQRVR